MTRRQIAADALANVSFRLRGSTDAATVALRDRVGAAIEGVRVRDIQRMGPGVLAELLPLVYPKMLSTAYAHQEAGRPAWIVTAASQEIADLVAHVLVFDGALGSGWEKAEGIYTGRPIEPFTYREGKAEAMRRLAEREGIDLAASFGYSDSESDLPMLQAVGHPVAVNPDRPLERVARAEGWEILRFERLGRRLMVGGAALGAALIGSAGRAAVQRRRPTGRARVAAPLRGLRR